MNKNKAKEDFKGNYSLIIEGNKVKIADKNGNVGVAKCDPTDTFDIDEGMKIAFDRMLEARRGIHVGDIVRVINNGHSYSTYYDWVFENVKSSDKCRYSYGRSCSNGTTGQVIAVAPHGSFKNVTLVFFEALDETDGNCYLVASTGLEKVEQNELS